MSDCAENPIAALGPGDYFQLGAYYRRNRDHYVFNRFATGGALFQHTTWVHGAALDGRSTLTEQQLLDLEREAFLSLVGQPKTLERIAHTLKTGKMLRN